MIEFSQSAQCLFCPQRRKLALLFKVVLSGSAAIIMTLILFLPRTAKVQPQPVSQNLTAEPLESGNIPADAMTQKSDEILAQAGNRHLEVQSQLKSVLVKVPPSYDKAKKLLETRQKEVLLTKVLVLGEALFEGSARAEGKKKIVLGSLEREEKELAEQIELLTKLD